MSKKIYFEDQPELPFEEWSNPYAGDSANKKLTAAPKPLYFCSFGSGSSGNSSYVGSREGGLIIDVGIRGEEIE
ncbi:MAG: hypothetical protein K2K23_05920, partial [Muribaculaceae bacterium]|nr:hypothetical protein [Muribaculaceae bacterium]